MRIVARINSARRTEATGGTVRKEKSGRGFPRRQGRLAVPHRVGGAPSKPSHPAEESRCRMAEATRQRSSSNLGRAEVAPLEDWEARPGGDGSKAASRASWLSRPVERAANNTTPAGTPGPGCTSATEFETTTHSYLALFAADRLRSSFSVSCRLRHLFSCTAGAGHVS
jgi:hypothetical protein